MELIRHLVQVQVKDGNYVYINTLNGAVDILNEETHQLIQKWQKSEICLESEYAKEVADFLDQRGYLVKNRQEEDLIISQLYKQLNENLLKCQEEYDQLILVLTYNCNFRCPYCYEQHVQTNGIEWVKKTMTREMVDQIAERYSNNIKRILLFGGEPFLLENRDIIEYILEKFKDVTFSAITNGYTLEEYLPLLKKYKFDFLEITLDGTEEIHNQRRCLANGERTYAKIMEGVEKTLEIGIPVKLRMNIDQANFEECSQLQRDLVKRFSAYPDFKIFRDAVFGEGYSQVCRSQILEKIFESDVQVDMKDIGTSLDSLHPITEGFKGNQWLPKYVSCTAHKGQLFFDAHGYIYTCWLSLGQEEFSLGKYYPEEERSGLPWLERTVDQMTPCKECASALLCGGGCAKIAYVKNGDIMRGVCDNNSLLIRIAIPYLYEKYIKY